MKGELSVGRSKFASSGEKLLTPATLGLEEDMQLSVDVGISGEREHKKAPNASSEVAEIEFQ